MNILLTNDDGIYAEGIYVLYEALKKVGNVTVVAPATEQSAVGHAITMSDPLRVKEARRRRQRFGYAVSGTPADCVKIAIRSLLRKKPDLVVSGINLGPNTGFSVLYSGTVSGATEGAILGIPSIAVSLGTFVDPDYRNAANFAAKLARLVHKNGLPKGTFLNLNVPALPASKIKGVRITTQGKTPIIERFDKRVDPRKRTYYWLTGEVMNLRGGIESDIVALKNGYISITPVQYDLTDHSFIDTLKGWRLR
ncbi:MAG: 5'/3'-nucleotidase SurE [Candidatus Omnitrophica bacterium]|nr:5'/3'-nucleotidase SurE [Candidatus Omnitrophota bacterium]